MRSPTSAPKPRRTPAVGQQNSGRTEVEKPSEEPPDGMVKFSLPIPQKPDALIALPADIDGEDWEMLKVWLDGYVGRLLKQRERGVAKQQEEES